MKTTEIAKKYQVDKDEFEHFLTAHQLRFSGGGLLSFSVDDNDVEKYVDMFKNPSKYFVTKAQIDHVSAEEQQRILAEQQRIAAERAKEEAKKKKALSEMLISSGFNFEGYRIVKYSGYISGDDAVEIPRTFTIFGLSGGDNGQKLTDALVKIRIQALKELKEAAYDLGCNAVIGVDFDYITLEPETADIVGKTVYQPYIICVTANGNAVVIEKN